MIHNVVSSSEFISVSTVSNFSNTVRSDQDNVGSVKYQNDTLYVHNGVSYIPYNEITYISFSEQLVQLFKWAQIKMDEDLKNKSILQKYPEAKKSLDDHNQLIKNLSAMEALIGEDKNIE